MLAVWRWKVTKLHHFVIVIEVYLLYLVGEFFSVLYKWPCNTVHVRWLNICLSCMVINYPSFMHGDWLSVFHAWSSVFRVFGHRLGVIKNLCQMVYSFSKCFRHGLGAFIGLCFDFESSNLFCESVMQNCKRCWKLESALLVRITVSQRTTV